METIPFQINGIKMIDKKRYLLSQIFTMGSRGDDMKDSRLFKIVYYILDKKHVTAPELAEKFEVSVRTIYRDIDVISSAGIPIYVTTGRNGGIEILDDYVLEQSFFSDKEKKDILSALQSVSVVNSSYEREMLTKLSALFQIPSDDWFEVDFSRWGNASQDNTTFELLKNAVISHKAVSILYVNSNGEKSRRKIYPIKMMFKSKEWYLKAYCVEKSDFRIFKCNRMVRLELLDEEFAPLHYPDEEETRQSGECQQYSSKAEGWLGRFTPMVLQFPKECAYRVYDEFEADSIKEQDNGDLLVSAAMREDQWLIGYLLSFGTQVTILEPARLKETIARQAKLIYEKNKP